MNQFPFPHPPGDPLGRPHWDGARQRRLLVQACEACGDLRFPATRYCPQCHGERHGWRECSGYGTVESFCVFHKAYWPDARAALPYAVIQVRLDEGVRFMSNPAGATAAALPIGARVRAVFEDVADGLTVVRFAAVQDE